MSVTTKLLPRLLHPDTGPAPRPRQPGKLLDRMERLLLGVQLTLATAAMCLLAVAAGLRFLVPGGRGISDMVAGAAALLVAVPVLVAAWNSLRRPSLHGITTASWRWRAGGIGPGRPVRPAWRGDAGTAGP